MRSSEKKYKGWVRGEVLSRAGKMILLVRMIAVLAMMMSWDGLRSNSPHLLFTLTILACYMILILTWDSISPFILHHPSIVIPDLLISATFIWNSGLASPLATFLFTTAFMIGMLYKGYARLLLILLMISTLASVSLVLLRDDRAAAESNSQLSLFISALIVFMATYIGTLLQELQSRIDAVLTMTSENSRAAALGEERSRLARELHDSVTKTLVGIGLQATALKLRRCEHAPQIEAIETAAKDGVTQTRQILTDLRHNSVCALHIVLSETLSEIETLYGVPIALESDEFPNLGSTISYEVRKIVEEAVVNAAKHSGTSNIDVVVCFASDPNTLRVSVKDYGIGLQSTTTPDGHFGLEGMKERAESIGGKLLIRSNRLTGTCLTVLVPIEGQTT